MFGLFDKMKKLDEPIRIGITGIGSIGRGMLKQAQITPGVQCLAVADCIVERAISAAERFNIDYKVAHTLSEMHEIIGSGKLAICEDGVMPAKCEMTDVFIEATNSVTAGFDHGITALENNKHLVMMNYESDLMFGSYLMNLAREKGLVYTVCDGDQPALLRRLIGEMEFMGFKLVMAGNIKGYLDRYSNPTSIVPEADKRGLDHKMCASYTDGTKLSIEMAVLANGLGLHTLVPGMLGPRINDIYRVFECFDFNKLWNGKDAFVDYVLGAKPYGGVFAIGYTDDLYQHETLEWLPSQMGEKPFYLFYRHYHLCHFESMISVAEAVINKRPVLQPVFGMKTNVYAYAKRDLRQGDKLDGIGGYTCYGMIENCSENISSPGLPVCLAENIVLSTDIPKDQKIYMDNVIFEPSRTDFRLYSDILAALAGLEH